MDFHRFRLPGFERTFGRKKRSRALLILTHVGKYTEDQYLEDCEELLELTRACQMKALFQMKVPLHKPNPKYFMGSGKLEEIEKIIEKEDLELLVVNADLSPAQSGNIEKKVGVPVVDRTALILEIFGRRAQSSEGKMQVELAQLQYALPRIGGLGTVMSRLGGGIGSRGPGEQELEKDRRKIRVRIEQVKKRVKQMRKHRGVVREGRKKKDFKTIALVGYTNAGKSSLLNSLTGANVKVQDQLFATLDPTVRVAKQKGRQDQFLFVDTVGFLRDLPHRLVEAFRATLEEASYADCLVHVLDVSNVHYEEFKRAVEEVLVEIGAGDHPCVLALNKVDLLDEHQKKELKDKFPEATLISAKEKVGFDALFYRIRKKFEENQVFA